MLREHVYIQTDVAPNGRINPAKLQVYTFPTAHEASGDPFGTANGDATIANDKNTSATLSAKTSRPYEVESLPDHLIIMAMVPQAINDIDAADTVIERANCLTFMFSWLIWSSPIVSRGRSVGDRAWRRNKE